MSNVYRYFLLAFVIFIPFYLFRLWQLAVISVNKIKPNQYLRIYATVDSLPQTEDGWQIFKVGQFWIKTESDEQFALEERIKIVGKPQARVINRFYEQTWLINPEIFKIESLSKSEKERFGKEIFFWKSWGNLKKRAIEFLVFIRRNSQVVYYQALPEPQGSLLAGIVLGTREEIDWDFWQALKRTGTLHIIAASGMNVTLVAKVVIDFLINFINRRRAYFVSIVCIFIYCLLAGASPAVVRAGLMVSLALLGLAFGREAAGGWLLFLAAALMLLVNPLLIFDVGFQLSFTAMAGMIFLRPTLSRIFRSLWSPPSNLLVFNSLREKLLATRRRNFDVVSRIKLAKDLRSNSGSSGRSHYGNSQNLSASSPTLLYKSNWLTSFFANNLLDTLSAQIATTPILFFTFGQFQPLSFIPNLFVFPLVPTLMMLGFVLLLCGLIWLPLAYPIAWLTWLPLTYFVEVIKWWSRVL